MIFEVIYEMAINEEDFWLKFFIPVGVIVCTSRRDKDFLMLIPNNLPDIRDILDLNYPTILVGYGDGDKFVDNEVSGL